MKKLFTLRQQSDRGFIALISVLIFAGVVLAIVTAVTMNSLEEGEMGSSQELSHASLAMADACAEYVISELGRNMEYDGPTTIELEERECEVVAVEEVDNQTKIIKTKSEFKNYIKKIQAQVTKSGPTLELEDWQEVGDF